MSVTGQLLDSLKTALQSASPTRTVTRNLEDFGRRDLAELEQGVFTLISRGRQPQRDETVTLNVLLVGQIAVQEGSAPSAVEEAELLMVDEIDAFMRGAQGARVMLDGGIQQSQQVDAPYGWVAARLAIGPVELAAYEDAGSLADFITYHADHRLVDGGNEPSAIDEVTLPT